jgi:hypothetical protein
MKSISFSAATKPNLFHLIFFSTLASMFVFPSVSNAYVMSDTSQFQCEVQTSSGPATVPEVVGYANGFAGYTQMGPNGIPYITFDNSVVQPIAHQLPVAVDFLFYHECAHARFGTNFNNQVQSELNANCEGLRQMRSDGKITPAQELAVGQLHASQNYYGNLFGSGANYWQLTLQCAASPPIVSASVYGAANTQMGSYCCTVAGKFGPFPPPHLQVGAMCVVPVNNMPVVGQACQ